MQREIKLSVVFEAAEVTRGGIVNRDSTKLGRDGVEEVQNAHLSYEKINR